MVVELPRDGMLLLEVLDYRSERGGE